MRSARANASTASDIIQLRGLSLVMPPNSHAAGPRARTAGFAAAISRRPPPDMALFVGPVKLVANTLFLYAFRSNARNSDFANREGKSFLADGLPRWAASRNRH
jgi:hypothetical protein